jgi:signal transduction histidine kinase
VTRSHASDSDTAAARRAARLVGWQLTSAAAGIVALVVVLSVAFIIDQSRPSERLEKPRPGQGKIYVDSLDVLTALIVVGLLAIAVAGVAGWLVARRAVRPLEDALRIQRTFVADASHELRTPLAVLDARIQVLQRRLPPGSDLEGGLVDLRRDAAVLIDVVNDLLRAAAAEERPGEAVVPDVAALVGETVRSLSVLAEGRGVRVAFHGPAHVAARISATSLRRCVVALLSNAVAHSAPGSTVEVVLDASRSSFELIVADHGAGIQGIEPDRIFERLAHSDAPSGSTWVHSGFGIGLSLVRDIVVRHGGSVDLRETSSAGTTIAFSLPRA